MGGLGGGGIHRWVMEEDVASPEEICGYAMKAQDWESQTYLQCYYYSCGSSVSSGEEWSKLNVDVGVKEGKELVNQEWLFKMCRGISGYSFSQSIGNVSHVEALAVH